MPQAKRAGEAAKPQEVTLMIFCRDRLEELRYIVYSVVLIVVVFGVGDVGVSGLQLASA